jgi:hypothetical protein
VSKPSENPFQDLLSYVNVDDYIEYDEYEDNEPETEPVPEIDWNRLEEVYPNVIGWAVCPGTSVNTPILYYKSKDAVPSDENAFYVISDGDAQMKNENCIIYAPHMDFSAYKRPQFTATETENGDSYTRWVFFMKSGVQYEAYIWNICNARKFNGFDIDTRNFKNLFEKKDWIDAVCEKAENEELLYAPDEIQQLLTVVGTGSSRYSLCFELLESF